MTERLEMYYRWLTMRVWVHRNFGGWQIEAEHADGSQSYFFARTLEDAKAKVTELRKEGNRKDCNI